MRIQTMQPDVKNHYIKFNKKHKRLLEQMFHFPMGAYDDGPDALEAAGQSPRKASGSGSWTGERLDCKGGGILCRLFIWTGLLQKA